MNTSFKQTRFVLVELFGSELKKDKNCKQNEKGLGYI
jgi:hypothetical protein